MKRNMVWGIAVLMLVLLSACGPKYNEESDFEVKPLDGGKSVEITKYVGKKFVVNIPQKIQGLSVTSIGKEAFKAFGKSLTSVTIPKSVTSIGEDAFSWCENLTSVTIPKGVTSIGKWAFWGCTSLPSITIPESVTSIGTFAFGDCNNLTKVNIPKGVTTIENAAFRSCTSLTGIIVDAKNAAYVSIDGVLFTKDRTILVQYPAGKQDGAYTIPTGVTSIEGEAFGGCTSLASVAIPTSITSIGDGAFREFKSLTSISIPEGVTSIGTFAFLRCENLASVSIPASVTSIGSQVFQDCKSLTSVTFEGNTITGANFGDNAFPQGQSRNDFGNNVRTAYRSGGAGTYTRDAGGSRWTKQ